jgi:hypothetical protein
MATNIIVKGGTGTSGCDVNKKAVRETVEMNKRFPAKAGSMLMRRLPVEVVQKAIREEGPEVMTNAAEGFWQETCDRAFPHTRVRDVSQAAWSGWGAGRCRCALNPTGKKRIA